MSVIEHPNQYDVDLVIIDDSGKWTHHVEVEIRLFWKEHAFPKERIGEYLNVPHRKTKFLNGGLPLLFFAINRNLTSLIWTTGQCILESDVSTNDNQKQQQNRDEAFYQVPLTKTHWVDLKKRGIGLSNSDYIYYLADLDYWERVNLPK